MLLALPRGRLIICWARRRTRWISIRALGIISPGIVYAHATSVSSTWLTKLVLQSGRDIISLREMLAPMLQRKRMFIGRRLDPLVSCVDRTDQATESKEYLIRMTTMIDMALGNGGRHVQVVLYEELDGFFTRMRGRVSEDGSKEVDLRKLEEPLAKLADQLFNRQIDGSVESIRKSRAQAVLAYISVSQEAGLPVIRGLDEAVRTWREGERSRPVQQSLEEALGKLGGYSG